MFARLVGGAEESSTLLISLTSEDRLLSRDVIRTFLTSPTLSGQSLLVKTGPSSVCKELNVSTEIDLSDSLGWRTTGEHLDFPDLVYNTVGLSSQNIVVDNLTDLLVFFKLSVVTQFIRKLRQCCGKKNKVFLVVHRDCLSTEIQEELAKFVTTTLNITDSKSEKVCKIHHLKPGGRLVNSTEVFRIDAGRNIQTSEYKEVTKTLVEEDEDAAIKTLTTFSLGTKLTEKEAKDKLVLPFYKDSQVEEGQVQIPGKAAGKIYYEPDSGDDWDDEDPDDDLDF